MIKKHLVPASIIVALLASNGVMAYQYNKDVDSLSSQLNVKKKNVVKLKSDNYKLNSLVDKQQNQINTYKSKIYKLNKLVDGKNKIIKKQKKDINSLKTKLESKKRNKEKP